MWMLPTRVITEFQETKKTTAVALLLWRAYFLFLILRLSKTGYFTFTLTFTLTEVGLGGR